MPADASLGRASIASCSAAAPRMYLLISSLIASVYAAAARAGPAMTASAAARALTIAGPMPSPCSGLISPAASPTSSTLPAAGGVPFPPIRSQPPTMGPGRAFGLRSPSLRSRAPSRSRSGRSGAGARRLPMPTPMPILAWPSAPGNSQP